VRIPARQQALGSPSKAFYVGVNPVAIIKASFQGVGHFGGNEVDGAAGTLLPVKCSLGPF
jgi:hypothetical protein